MIFGAQLYFKLDEIRKTTSIFLKMEDNLDFFLKMEDNLILLEWKRTSISLKIEDDLILFNWKTTSIVLGNGRQPQFLKMEDNLK
jgi:hypothetical protein